LEINIIFLIKSKDTISPLLDKLAKFATLVMKGSDMTNFLRTNLKKPILTLLLPSLSRKKKTKYQNLDTLSTL
jgi:hypothetical protein